MALGLDVLSSIQVHSGVFRRVKARIVIRDLNWRPFEPGRQEKIGFRKDKY